jgi:hypothetical protein
MPHAKVFALLGGRVALLCGTCGTMTTLTSGAPLVCAHCAVAVRPAPGYPLVTEPQPPTKKAQDGRAGKEKLRHDGKRKRRRRKPVMPVVR